MIFFLRQVDVESTASTIPCAGGGNDHEELRLSEECMFALLAKVTADSYHTGRIRDIIRLLGGASEKFYLRFSEYKL